MLWKDVYKRQADGPAMVVAALIDYTDTDPEVKTIVDETVALSLIHI